MSAHTFSLTESVVTLGTHEQNDLIISKNFQVKKINLLSIIIVAILSYISVNIYGYVINIYNTLNSKFEQSVFVFFVIILMLNFIFGAEFYVNKRHLTSSDVSAVTSHNTKS